MRPIAETRRCRHDNPEPHQKTIVHLDLKRDECPVIARSGGDADAIKKQFAKLNRVLSGIPLGPDPAIELKKTRNRRGLV